MKKLGFTLAEVLVTLGIIGVVAALTMPALVNNTGNAKAGPALAKFVNTFENGSRQMMEAEGVDSIFSKEEESHLNYNDLAKYIIMAPYSNNHKYTNGDGSKEFSFSSYAGLGEYKSGSSDFERLDGEEVTMYPWQLKDGTVISFIQNNAGHVKVQNKGAFTAIGGILLVDINGEGAPNKAGTDVFAFVVEKKGVLVPASGNVHKWIQLNPNIQSNTQFVKYDETCSQTSSDLAKNFACTGKIADNGWKSNNL